MLLIDELLLQNSYFGQYMHKNVLFLLKNCKNHPCLWRLGTLHSDPQPRRLRLCLLTTKGLRRLRSDTANPHWEFLATPLHGSINFSSKLQSQHKMKQNVHTVPPIAHAEMTVWQLRKSEGILLP